MLLAVLVVASLVGKAAGALTSNECPKDSQWSYILEYFDDTSKNDIPDRGVDIVPGFALENAYWIGSEALKRYDITETQLCFQNSETCSEKCENFPIDGPPISKNGWYTSTRFGGIEHADDFAWDQPTRHKRFLATVAGSGDSHPSVSGPIHGDGVPAKNPFPHGYAVEVYPRLKNWMTCGKAEGNRYHWASFFTPMSGGGFNSGGGYWVAARGNLEDPLWEIGWSNRRPDCGSKMNVFQIRVKGTSNGVPNPGLGARLTTTLPPPSSFAPTANKCLRDPDWSYVLDYHDDNNRDDIPNDEGDIVKGMDMPNAFFIGNDKLEEWNIDRLSLCLVLSSSCKESCVEIPIDTTFPNSCPLSGTLTKPVNRFVASMSGQCEKRGSPSEVFAEGLSGFDDWFISQPNPNANIKILYETGGGWHMTPGDHTFRFGNRGMDLSYNDEFNEMWHYSRWEISNIVNPRPDLDDEDKWDSFQIRVKGTPPSTSTATATSTSVTMTVSTTTTSTPIVFVDDSPSPCFLAGSIVGLVVFLSQTDLV